jgi:hypothetical protein
MYTQEQSLDGQGLDSSESDTFKESQSRILVNKTILDNGFLLIEEINQFWLHSL